MRRGGGIERGAGLGGRGGRDARVPGLDRRLDHLGRLRLREEEALAVIAAEAAQQLELVVVLHSLRDGAETEALREADDRADDLLAAVLLEDRADEGAIDLQCVAGETPEEAERRVAGAEVVDLRPDALSLEPVEQRRDPSRVVEDGALRDLEAKRPRWQT